MNKDNVSRKVLALQWYKERINDMLASKDTSYKLQYLYDYPLWPFVQKWVNVAKNSIYANEMIYQSVVRDALVELIGMNYDVIDDALLEYKYEILIHKFCREYRSVNEIKSNWSDVAYYLRWYCYSENILSVLSYDCKINESKDDVNVLEVFREFLSKWTKLFNDKVYNLVSNLLEEKKFTLPEVFNKDNDLLKDDFEDFDDFDDFYESEDNEDSAYIESDNKEDSDTISVMFQIDTYNKCLEHLINPSVYKNHEEIIREIANKLGRVAGETKDTTIMESMLQYSYPSPPFEDIEGVTSGNRIMDMLPIEFSYFADKTTEILFYQRFATKQLQQFSSFPKEKNQNIQSTSVKTKGPIIISIDTSSSMYGKPIDFAKWLVLKVFDIAVKENRPLYIIDFSVGCKSLDLSGENGREELVNFLKDCISGGSSGNEMMQEILLQLEKDTYKYADALIVSDFRFPALKPEIYNKVKASQKLGTKFYGVFVNDFPNINYTNVLDASWKVVL
jgi:uncharacterized protein with von Willebrand factor type A (vWA) domain